MNKKIKVLRIIARLNIGGPARHVVILTEGLDKNRYDSVLVYGDVAEGEGDMSGLAKASGIRCIFMPEMSRSINPIGDIRAFFRIFSIIRKEKPQIVHTHTAKAGTIGRLAAIAAGVPVTVHTFHGHVFHGYFNRALTGYFLMVERMLAKFTDRIIAISDSQKDELLSRYKIGDERKYSRVDIGLDLEAFFDSDKKRGGLRRRFGLKDDDMLVGIVGRLVPVKNHRMFIKAAAGLKNRISPGLFNKVKFIVVGDGTEKKDLAEYARSLGIENNILFTGWLDDMAEVYADLDIVALTSNNEGTPVSLIEAMASAKPVISTDVGGVMDVVGDAGILVKPGDDEAYAVCLAELVASDAARRGLGSKGRDRVKSRYSKENLIREMDSLYEKMLSEKGLLK